MSLKSVLYDTESIQVINYCLKTSRSPLSRKKIFLPILSFNDCSLVVWEWISNFISSFIMDIISVYLSMLRLKLMHVGKRTSIVGNE